MKKKGTEREKNMRGAEGNGLQLTFLNPVLGSFTENVP